MAKKTEEGTGGTPQAAVAQEIVFKYEGALTECNLSKNDLPKGIKSQIQVLMAQAAKYKKNPTDNLFNSVRTQDVKIADQIITFSEESIVEQTEEEKQKQLKMENEEKEKLAAAEKEAAEKAAKETAEATAKAKEAEEAAAAAAKAKADADELAAKEKAAADKKDREGAFGNEFIKGMYGQ